MNGVAFGGEGDAVVVSGSLMGLYVFGIVGVVVVVVGKVGEKRS